MLFLRLLNLIKLSGKPDLILEFSEAFDELGIVLADKDFERKNIYIKELHDAAEELDPC